MMVTDPYVAVRGQVTMNTTVYGICFYSNDATSFPEIVLASDSGYERLPAVGVTLRSVTGVAGGQGYVNVAFEPYLVKGNKFLWALIRFPNREPITGQGLGGGPGIGWTGNGRQEQRYFFGADGSTNEFMGAFDISLVTQPFSVPTAPGLSSPDSEKESLRKLDGRYPNALISSLSLPGVGSTGAGTGIRFEVHAPADIDARVFDVLGRRVRSLWHQSLSPGTYYRMWDGNDDAGRHVASGVYIVTVRAPGVELIGKTVRVR
jgi:hypothetical protein